MKIFDISVVAKHLPNVAAYGSTTSNQMTNAGSFGASHVVGSPVISHVFHLLPSREEQIVREAYARLAPGKSDENMVADWVNRIRLDESSLLLLLRSLTKPAPFRSEMDSAATGMSQSAEDAPSSRPLHDVGGTEPIHINHFLQYHDIQFVQQAYGHILGREADTASLQHFCTTLRTGELSKKDVLAVLRYSREGISRGVKITGLMPHRRMSLAIQKVPLLGWLVTWAKAVAAIPRLVRNMRALETRLDETATMLGQLRHTTLSAVQDAAATTDDKLRVLENQVDLVDLANQLRERALDRRLELAIDLLLEQMARAAHRETTS